MAYRSLPALDWEWHGDALLTGRWRDIDLQLYAVHKIEFLDSDFHLVEPHDDTLYETWEEATKACNNLLQKTNADLAIEPFSGIDEYGLDRALIVSKKTGKPSKEPQLWARITRYWRVWTSVLTCDTTFEYLDDAMLWIANDFAREHCGWDGTN